MSYNPLQTFLEEADELLTEIEQSALLLSTGEQSDETIHQLFRAFHTIKGSGAMCGLQSVASFTHHVESLLDQVREGAVAPSKELGDLLMKAGDHIKTLLSAEQGGPAAAPGSGEALVAAVEALGRREAPAQPKTASTATAPTETKGQTEAAWRITFRPNPGLLENGSSPVALFRDLQTLGRCEIVGHTDEVPTLDSILPEQCYLWWTVILHSACDLNAIRDVFIFVEDDSKLEIERMAESEPGKTGPAPRAEIPAATPTAPETRKTAAKESTVRVPSDRLDHLVNLVGELVMNQSRLQRAVAQNGAADFANPVQELERLVAELRDEVLGIRMLPIGTLFGRFRRLVHELAGELGKEADLVTEGAETELDKSILDQLGEPLVHCLRNCLDHAIETPEDREAAGKPRRGTVRLSAIHRGSDVVVSIHDDGRGISRAAVRAKAIEKQLISADTNLSDQEIFNLILLPGFSTAKQVTSVSGRGVGMDAVKRQIDALRGSLSLSSEEGKGTLISITLPLTLAIIDGLLVQVGEDQFIIPMAAVTENVELAAAERGRNNGRNVIAVRGELVPYIDLRAAFQIDGDSPAIEKVVIVGYEGQRVGLIVDRVLGTHQTVIQSLGRFFRSIEVVSGATIMGDGRVALILDITAVVRYVDRDCREHLLRCA